jgi:hypothetical protein
VQCVSGSDCQPGSICTTGHVCACRPPSTTNLLADPGFDQVTFEGDWNPMGTSAWTADDADGCAGSGAAALGSGSDGGEISQCVPVKAQVDYYLGFQFKQTTPMDAECDLTFYALPNCSGDANIISAQAWGGDTSNITSSFEAASFAKVNSPVGAQSAQVACSSWNLDPVEFDQIYLNTSGAAF